MPNTGSTIEESLLDRLSPASSLTDTAIRLRDNVAALVPEMHAQAAAAERQGAITDEISRALARLGVFDMGKPEDFGGLASGARDLIEVLAAVGRGDGSAGWLTATATNNDMLALAYPRETVEEIFTSGTAPIGPRLVAASIFARQIGEARATEGGWLLTGKWGFASGCRTAEWSMVGADYVTEDGTHSRGLALIPRDDYEILDDWKVSGMAATSSNSIVVEEEVFVPARRFIDLRRMPAMMDALQDHYTGVAYGWRAEARIVVVTMNLAAVALGMAQGALECLASQAPARTPFNLPYPTIADAPGTQIVAGRVRAGVDAARAVVERIADGIDRISAEGLDFTPAEASRLHMDLVFAIRLCSEAIVDAEVALGSSAAALSNPVQRYARDIRVLASHGAIRFDPLAEINGRDVLGRPPLPPPGAPA